MGIRDSLVYQRVAPESTIFVLDPSRTEGSAVHSWSSCSKWLFHACHCQLLWGSRVHTPVSRRTLGYMVTLGTWRHLYASEAGDLSL